MRPRELDVKTAEHQGILKAHLSQKKTVEDCYDHPRYPFTPKYVVAMLDDLLKVVQRANPSATFDQLRRADRMASGHVDYFEKMCLYVHEIEEGRFPCS